MFWSSLSPAFTARLTSSTKASRLPASSASSAEVATVAAETFGASSPVREVGVDESHVDGHHLRVLLLELDACRVREAPGRGL